MGMLSKIERGRVSPSLGTLRYLAGRVGVPLAALFAGRRRRRRRRRGAAALGDARAALWLGDPAEAERRARAVAGGAQGRAGGERLRAAALGLVAEAMLERGSAEGAARELAAASESPPARRERRAPGGDAGAAAGRGGGRRGCWRGSWRGCWGCWSAAGGARRGRSGPGAGPWSCSTATPEEAGGAVAQGGRRRRGAPARPTALLLRARLLLELGGCTRRRGARRRRATCWGGPWRPSAGWATRRRCRGPASSDRSDRGAPALVAQTERATGAGGGRRGGNGGGGPGGLRRGPAPGGAGAAGAGPARPARAAPRGGDAPGGAPQPAPAVAGQGGASTPGSGRGGLRRGGASALRQVAPDPGPGGARAWRAARGPRPPPPAGPGPGAWRSDACAGEPPAGRRRSPRWRRSRRR